MSDKDTTIEMYKLEYEKGAERYENIYKAVWANFSYLTVVSGGIYAFGSRLFSWETTAVLAIIPLAFWWLAIFEPMNRYGDEVADRLSEVEKILNSLYAAYIITPLQHNPPPDVPPEGYGLKHYSRFTNRRRDEFAGRVPTPKVSRIRKILEVSMPDPWFKAPRLGLFWIWRVVSGFIVAPRTRYWVRAAIISLSVIVLLFAKGIIPPAFFSTADTVIIDRPLKPLDGRVAGTDVQDLEEKAKDDVNIKRDLDKLKEALKTVSDDVKARKSK